MRGGTGVLNSMNLAQHRIEAANDRHPIGSTYQAFLLLHSASDKPPAVALEKRRYAARLTARACAINPGCWEAWTYRGIALASLPDPDRANTLACFKEALVHVSEDRCHEVLPNRGIARLLLQEPARSLADTIASCELQPLWLPSWTARAKALELLGRPDEVADARRRAKALGDAVRSKQGGAEARD